MARSPDAVLPLPQHERESHYPDIERIRHRRELHMVREVGVEEVLGLGKASDFRCGRLRRMRDLSLPGRPGQPWQRGEHLYVWTRRGRNGRQRCVDVRMGVDDVDEVHRLCVAAGLDITFPPTSNFNFLVPTSRTTLSPDNVDTRADLHFFP
jgi:hypothetical protein